MICPQDCPVVGKLGSQGSDLRKENILVYFAETFLSEQCGYGFHFLRNGSVVCGQICMVTARCGNHEIVAVVREIHSNRCNYGCSGILEIDSHDTAVGACDLVHQAAWLAEVDVLCLLSHDGKLSGGEAVGIIKIIEDGSQQNFYRRRTAESGALEDAGAGICAESADPAAALGESIGHARNQRGGGAEKSFVWIEAGEIDCNSRIAFAYECDFVVRCAVNRCYGIKVD